MWQVSVLLQLGRIQEALQAAIESKNRTLVRQVLDGARRVDAQDIVAECSEILEAQTLSG